MVARRLTVVVVLAVDVDVVVVTDDGRRDVVILPLHKQPISFNN